MSSQEHISPIELGGYLTQIRDKAGIKQAELARRVTWSQAVLSRIESGDRAIAPEELDQLLDAIATPEAEQLKTALHREWSVLARPGLDHPDQELLWSAEEVAQQLTQSNDEASRVGSSYIACLRASSKAGNAVRLTASVCLKSR